EWPTYRSQQQRVWPQPAAATGDASGLGLVGAGHPLLGAAVVVAAPDGRPTGGDEVVLTGRWSLAGQPWLADHRVAGRVVVPGTAWLEVAVRAGDEADCPVVAEWTLLTPLVLGEHTAVQVQVRVGPGDAVGGRARGLY